jgi:hypothetical protein
MKRAKPDTAPATTADEPAEAPQTAAAKAAKKSKAAQTTSPDAAPAPEVGGRDGPDPTRFGDWEKNGRCVDF